MSGSVNKVILIGNVGKDPDIRSTQDGRKIANFRLATSETWRDKNSGERREKTEWSTVVVFGPLAGVVEAFVQKGTKLYVEGALQTRKWQDQSGQDRYSTEVVVQGYGASLHIIGGGSGNRDPGSDADDRRADHGQSASSGGKSGSFDKPMDYDIPF